MVCKYIVNTNVNTLAFNMFSRHQQHQHHLGICQKCKFSGSTSDFLNNKLEMSDSPSPVVQMHTQVWKPVLKSIY